jgi:hypothetical protein
MAALVQNGGHHHRMIDQILFLVAGNKHLKDGRIA